VLVGRVPLVLLVAAIGLVLSLTDLARGPDVAG
jgi:hypothetical protein